MKELTPEAQATLDRYMADVRTALCGSTLVDADDVLREVKEHIERELETEPAPVTAPVLDAVLQRLGKPDQWVPTEEQSSWKQLVGRLRSGPDDWRFAYVSFGLLILAAILGLNPLLIILSFAAARASMTALGGCPQDARKWLIYPALILVYIPLAALLLFWPFLLAVLCVKATLGVDLHRMIGTPSPVINFVLAALFVLVAFCLLIGLQLLPLGAVLRRKPHWVQALFRPFADGFTSRHGTMVLHAGGYLILLALAVVAAVVVTFAIVVHTR